MTTTAESVETPNVNADKIKVDTRTRTQKVLDWLKAFSKRTRDRIGRGAQNVGKATWTGTKWTGRGLRRGLGWAGYLIFSAVAFVWKVVLGIVVGVVMLALGLLMVFVLGIAILATGIELVFKKYVVGSFRWMKRDSSQGDQEGLRDYLREQYGTFFETIRVIWAATEKNEGSSNGFNRAREYYGFTDAESSAVLDDDSSIPQALVNESGVRTMNMSPAAFCHWFETPGTPSIKDHDFSQYDNDQELYSLFAYMRDQSKSARGASYWEGRIQMLESYMKDPERLSTGDHGWATELSAHSLAQNQSKYALRSLREGFNAQVISLEKRRDRAMAGSSSN